MCNVFIHLLILVMENLGILPIMNYDCKEGTHINVNVYTWGTHWTLGLLNGVGGWQENTVL